MGRKAKKKQKRRERKIETQTKIVDAYYKANIDKFIEDCLGVELHPYQRFFIKKFAKWGFKNG